MNTDVRSSWVFWTALAVMIGLIGGAQSVSRAQSATPTITSLSPSTVVAGSQGFTLTVNGTNFVQASVIYENGTATTGTQYVSATELTLAVPTSSITTAGTDTITVENSAGGTPSNSETFTITASGTTGTAPTITSISPSTAVAGSLAVSLTVNGTGYVTGSVVDFGTTALSTQFVSAVELTATVPASAIATKGTVSVTVVNPSNGGTSNGVNFVVTSNVIASGPPTVVGNVTLSLDGTQVTGATVTLTAQDGSTFTGTTGASVLEPDGKVANYSISSPLVAGVYTIAVTDAGYNPTASNVTTVTVQSDGTIRQDLMLDPLHVFGFGLQMFSVPNDYTGMPIDSVLADLGATPLYVWSPSTLLYNTYPVLASDRIEPGQSYWANLPVPIGLVGAPAVLNTTTPFTITLSPGWNMIADPFPFSVNTGDLRADTFAGPVAADNLILTVLYRYDTATGAYDPPGSVSTLDPYDGYWVYALAAGNLLVYPPNTAP